MVGMSVGLSSKGFVPFVATFAAFFLAKQINQKAFMLIPDAAGWLSYETFPRILGFDVKKIKTDSGVVDLIDLDTNIEKNYPGKDYHRIYFGKILAVFASENYLTSE